MKNGWKENSLNWECKQLIRGTLRGWPAISSNDNDAICAQDFLTHWLQISCDIGCMHTFLVNTTSKRHKHVSVGLSMSSCILGLKMHDIKNNEPASPTNQGH